MNTVMNPSIKDADRNWYQIVVPDPHALTGASVREFAEPFGQMLAVTAVFIDDVIGAAELEAANGSVLSWTAFLGQVERAAQYDWAFFFLFTDAPPASDFELLDQRDQITASATTIRLVDDGYFYTYTTDHRIVNYLTDRYGDRALELNMGSVSDLSIPQ